MSPDVDEKKRLAKLRMQAIEGFLSCSATPLARQLGILVVSRADTNQNSRNFGGSYLCEQSMAIRLGASVPSIARVKKELLRMDLIEVASHAGPDHQSVIRPNWRALRELAIATNARANAIVREGRSGRGFRNKHITDNMLNIAYEAAQHIKSCRST